MLGYTDKAIITKRSYTHAWIVCMVGALYFFYMFIQITKFNAIGNAITTDFNLDATGLGTLSSAYFWGNVLFLLPAGMLLDRFSTKKLLAIVLLVAIIATLCFSFTTNIHTAFITLFFVGIAGAFGLTLPLRLASRWFPPEKMALTSGVIIACGFTGAMVGQSPLIWLVNQVGWRHAMQMNVGLGVFFFVLMMIVIKDFPKGVTPGMMHEEISGIKFVWHCFRQSVTNAQNWLFGLYTCFINLPVFVFAAFGVSYLHQVRQLSEIQAGFIMVIMFIGSIIGSPITGWISDKMKLRKVPMIIAGFIGIVIILAIMYLPSLSYLSAAVLFFALGFIMAAQNITYPVVAESSPEKLIGTSIGMASILIMSGGAIFLPFFGWLLDFHHTGQMVGSIAAHSASDYMFALWMLPITFLIGTIAVMFGKETHCKRIV